MKVVGFVGHSGTGKSHRALWVANERGLDFIIDDGLLIKGNRVVAGTSAKKEVTRIGSIKRALFLHKDHADEVKKAIEEHKPAGILIIGTSDGMIDAIARNLGLPEAEEKVDITDVADEFEIKKALQRERRKHVIPVPTFEIKQTFRAAS